MATTNVQHPDIRCACGRLLARRTPSGFELKCTRCKALWRLPLDLAAGTQQLLVVAKPN